MSLLLSVCLSSCANDPLAFAHQPVYPLEIDGSSGRMLGPVKDQRVTDEQNFNTVFDLVGGLHQSMYARVFCPHFSSFVCMCFMFLSSITTQCRNLLDTTLSMYWRLVARFIDRAGYSLKMVKKCHKGDSYKPSLNFYRNFHLGAFEF